MADCSAKRTSRGLGIGSLGACAGVAFACALLTMPAQATAEAPGASVKDSSVSSNTTVITSEQLSFDYETRRGLFERNVKVRNNDISMDADRMVVLFSAASTLTNMVATGSVRIMQTDRVATCATAVCYVAEGRMVLTGNPEIRRGEEMVKGNVITIVRDVAKKTFRIDCSTNAYFKLGPGAKLDDLRLSE